MDPQVQSSGHRPPRRWRRRADHAPADGDPSVLLLVLNLLLRSNNNQEEPQEDTLLLNGLDSTLDAGALPKQKRHRRWRKGLRRLTTRRGSGGNESLANTDRNNITPDPHSGDEASEKRKQENADGSEDPISSRPPQEPRRVALESSEPSSSSPLQLRSATHVKLRKRCQNNTDYLPTFKDQAQAVVRLRPLQVEEVVSDTDGVASPSTPDSDDVGASLPRPPTSVNSTPPTEDDPVASTKDKDDDLMVVPVADQVYLLKDGDEANTNLEALFAKKHNFAKAASVPLSEATRDHTFVHNDTIKVVMVSASSVDKGLLARRLCNIDAAACKPNRKASNLSLDVLEWRPSVTYQYCSNENLSSIKCMVWNVQGADSGPEDRTDFGAHPATQSLFFSENSLYILVWDLAGHNSEADPTESSFSGTFGAMELADRALRVDIAHRALLWLDTIIQRFPNSAVLPVALIPDFMSEAEAKRRCDIFQKALQDHVCCYKDEKGETAPTLLMGASGTVLAVNSDGNMNGIEQLQDRVIAVASDPSHSVFDHVESQIPPGTVLVYQAIKKFKKYNHKLILLDLILDELKEESVGKEEIVAALQFLASFGEILYYCRRDHVLSRYIILDSQWLVAALSCIQRNCLSNKFKQELDCARRTMNQQCLFTSESYPEHDMTRALINDGTSNCPLLSSGDAKMLWQYMSFHQGVTGRCSIFDDSPANDNGEIYSFFERLLVDAGVFLPLTDPNSTVPGHSSSDTAVFFVPSLLLQEAPPPCVWTYMTSESFMTTLCHSWLFREGAPPDLMERLSVSVLKDLYNFSKAGSSEITACQRSCVRILHVISSHCCFVVRIGTSFANSKTGCLQESIVDVFVSTTGKTSSHSVASDVMDFGMHRLVVSGKGQAGYDGFNLWKGGYQCILESVRKTLSNLHNVDSQVVCPECLAHLPPRTACTWGWDDVIDSSDRGLPSIRCSRFHQVDIHLLCGTLSDPSKVACVARDPIVGIKSVLPSVVLVGGWDPERRSLVSVGSGFIVDKNVGFIVTAAHVLFDMKNPREDIFGRLIPKGRVVIAVIPDAEDGGMQAVFRYFAEVVAHDIQNNVDACILRITAQMDTDVTHKARMMAIDQPEHPISTAQMAEQGLHSLTMTTEFQLEESVRISGYNQGGEGKYEKCRHISLSVDVVLNGKICRNFVDPMDPLGSITCSERAFKPRSEIKTTCVTAHGHSGGPCINSQGLVIGCLSRSHLNHSFMVPVSEIQPLIRKAQQHIAEKW